MFVTMRCFVSYTQLAIFMCRVHSYILNSLSFLGQQFEIKKNYGYKYLSSFLAHVLNRTCIIRGKHTTAQSSSHELFGRKIVFKAWNKWSKEIPVLFCSTFKTQTAWLMIIANSKQAIPWKLWQCIIGRFVKQITRLVDDKLKLGNLNVFWQAGKKNPDVIYGALVHANYK